MSDRASIDHAGIRGAYLRFVDMANLARVQGADIVDHSFLTWLMKQPVGWLNAYGVSSVQDVKDAVSSWLLWSARVDR